MCFWPVVKFWINEYGNTYHMMLLACCKTGHIERMTCCVFAGHSLRTSRLSCGTSSSVCTSACLPTRSAVATPPASWVTSSPSSTTTPTWSSSKCKSPNAGHCQTNLALSHLSCVFFAEACLSNVFLQIIKLEDVDCYYTYMHV